MDQHEPIGVMVDSVKEVVNLSTSEIERVPLATITENGYVSGIGKQEHGLISLSGYRACIAGYVMPNI